MEKANKFLEMQVFITVVDMGSFVDAADKLNMSKQAVSRYISGLEDRLQSRLIQRTTRKMSLTHEGQHFYLQAKSILDSLDEAEATIHPDQAEPRGVIRINVPVSFGILHLAPLWSKFMEKYPQITLDITLADRVVDILEEGIDLAVRIGLLASSSLISRKLTATKIIPCASPAYLAKYGVLTHPHDLLQHNIIAYSHWMRKEQWLFQDANKDEIAVKVTPQVYSNNGDTCRIMVLNHSGISLQPDFIVGEDLKAGRLVNVLPDYKVDDLNIYAVYPSRVLLPLRTRCLIDFLVENLKSCHWQM